MNLMRPCKTVDNMIRNITLPWVAPESHKIYPLNFYSYPITSFIDFEILMMLFMVPIKTSYVMAYIKTICNTIRSKWL